MFAKSIHHFSFLTLFLASSPALAVELDAYPQLREVADRLIAEQLYTEAELQALFAPAQIQNRVLKAMSRQYEALPWYKYRALLISPQRIQQGGRFMREHRATLRRAQQTYGVPSAVIAAIIGVETNYGDNTGSDVVRDSLLTLAAELPRRSKYFTSELYEFLRLAKLEGLDAQALTGSFAGAVGIPQFMPSSYRAYAVDFNANGRRDLLGEVEDAIGSVANYLAEHGWRTGEPAYLPVSAPLPEAARALLRKSASLETSLGQLRKATGQTLNSALEPSTRASFFALEAEGATRYIAGLTNLYVITRYNNSRIYAMAVLELSELIERAAHG